MQCQPLLAAENVQLEVEDDAPRCLATIAAQVNAEVENIGTRRLHTVTNRLLKALLFDVPNHISPGSVLTITPELVEERLRNVVKNRDLSRYIL